MEVELTAELESFVRSQAASGLYVSESEVVREALRLLERREAIRHLTPDELKRKIDEGLADADAGRLIPLDDDLIRRVKEDGRRRLTERSATKTP
ncbi:MAG: type II toxin-antitoxin system ParD family antitoxin [Phycisphaerales bacterium]|nr:type II toxin-antitoxin system ParD family antitoxin [Phycisphaerales bacterium]